MFDEDDNGFISESELRKVLTSLQGPNLQNFFSRK